jgi:hypothetical protein
MTEQELNHIEYIKDCFYNEDYLPMVCHLEIQNPKFKNLIFGFLFPKKIYVLNTSTGERIEC